MEKDMSIDDFIVWYQDNAAIKAEQARGFSRIYKAFGGDGYYMSAIAYQEQSASWYMKARNLMGLE